MELTERKKKVLRSVVDLYIRTAEPVGSKAITELPDMKYSSATIRNEMAELTAMGYLEQPHTSAGRIPSAAGYRPTWTPVHCMRCGISVWQKMPNCSTLP